jgi:hypothetical protein
LAVQNWDLNYLLQPRLHFVCVLACMQCNPFVSCPDIRRLQMQVCMLKATPCHQPLFPCCSLKLSHKAIPLTSITRLHYSDVWCRYPVMAGGKDGYETCHTRTWRGPPPIAFLKRPAKTNLYSTRKWMLSVN